MLSNKLKLNEKNNNKQKKKQRKKQQKTNKQTKKKNTPEAMLVGSRQTINLTEAESIQIGGKTFC